MTTTPPNGLLDMLNKYQPDPAQQGLAGMMARGQTLYTPAKASDMAGKLYTAPDVKFGTAPGTPGTPGANGWPTWPTAWGTAPTWWGTGTMPPRYSTIDWSAATAPSWLTNSGRGQRGPIR